MRAVSCARGSPVQAVLYIDLGAGCVRCGLPGGLWLAAVSAPIVALFEKLRVDQLHIAYSWRLIELQTGFEVLMALIVGWLVRRLAAEGAQAEARADEAEMLRDELGRRADLAAAAYEAERRTVDELRRRIDEAAKYVPLDQLALSPQCGFSSTVHGNDITVDTEIAKLKRVIETAQKVWG